MKLIIGNKIYGPFTDIFTLDDRYRADGCELAFGVVANDDGESQIVEVDLPAGFDVDAYEWIDGALTLKPIPPEALDAQKAAAITKTYIDVDLIYEEKVGKRGPEYVDSEREALAYQAAGYTGAVSPYISGFALSNGTGQVQTATWAANAILAQAAGLRAAQLAMRNTRFDSQKAMRAATTQAQLDAAVAGWNGFIAALRATLGI